MYRIAFFLVIFAAVTAVAQEITGGTESEAAQARQETADRQAEEEAYEDVPDLIDPTEEFSEDNPEDFPVNI